MSVNPDGTYSFQPGKDGDIILGTVNSDDRSWTGEGEISSLWMPFSDVPVSIPDNLKTVEMVVAHDGTGNFANVGFDGDDVYIQGIFEAAPEAWIKGKRDGDKISFLSGQFLGFDSFFNRRAYFVAANIQTIYDEYWNEWYDAPIYQDNIIFNYDEVNNKMTSGEKEAIVYNGESDEMSYFEYYISPSIYSQPADISPIPSNPFDLEYSDNYEDFGYNYIIVELPFMNIDGFLLKKSDLYYRIFINDEIFTFSPDEYLNLNEEMTLVPYDFKSGYDFNINGMTHQIYFYIDGIENIGVQLCYMENGEISGESEVVSISTSGLSNLSVDGSAPVKSYFYDVNGKEINPTKKGILKKGIFIRVDQYPDGSKKNSKIAR